MKKITIDERESEVVKTIFKLVTEYGYGGYKVAGYLNDRKILTKRGNFWTTFNVMNLLKNPIYKGQYVSGKRKSERGQSKRINPENWICSNEILTELIIVDEATWNKAEDIRNARKERTGKYPAQTKGPLLFVGLAKCGYCGNTMTSRYAVKQWTRKKDGAEIRYLQPKYICQKRNTKKICTGQSTYSQKKIDPVILEEVYSYLGMLKEINLSTKIDQMQDNIVKINETELQEIKAQIQKTENEVNVLNNEIIKCLTGESSFTSGQLSKIITQKETQLEQLQDEEIKTTEMLKEKLKEVNAFADFQKMILDWISEFEEAPREVKKMLMARLIDSVYIYSDRIDVHFKYNLFDLQ